MSAYLWMCFSMFMMALMGAMTHHLGRTASCPWQMVALVRMVCMMLVMIPILRFSGVRFPWHASRNLWRRTLAGSCGVVCTFFSLSVIPVSDATTLYNTAPIWIVLFTWLVYRVAPGWKICLAILCCMIGTVIVHHPRFAVGNVREITAVVAAASTAVFMAVAFMNLNTLKFTPSLAIVMHFSFWGSILLLILCLFTCGLTRAALPDHFYPDGLLLLGVGIAGAIGQVALTKAYKNGVAAKVSIVGLSQVVFAAGLEIFLWHRTYTPLETLGFFMILLPVAAVIAHNAHTRPA